MKKIIEKIKKERWHLHAGCSALIALIGNLLLIKETYLPLTAGLEAAFLLAFVGVLWELYWIKMSAAVFSYSDVLANAFGAFVLTFLYHLIF